MNLGNSPIKTDPFTQITLNCLHFLQILVSHFGVFSHVRLQKAVKAYLY